ncbi:MAG: hypothetical protein M5U34_03425 [Chloroflexi bacterium]|nr:hypothetical protein [Chloroflexota bacterium]
MCRGNVGMWQKTAVLRDLPIFMAVGKQDPLIPYAHAQTCAHTLEAAGANLAYHEYDTGHKLNSQGMRDLKAWWRQFTEPFAPSPLLR